jgi:hypothetical protein
MRFVGSVVRFFSLLGIFCIGLASVAQAAGADRKAAREEREKRVLIAVKARSTDSDKKVQKTSPRVSAQSVSRSQQQYVQRLVSGAKYALNFDKGVLAAENRVIVSQNRTLRQLSVAVNPNRILALQSEALALQASIDRNLTYINAIQPTIASALSALQAFVGVVPGVAATYNRLVTTATVDQQKAAVIASRPPFTIPPATAAI